MNFKVLNILQSCDRNGEKFTYISYVLKMEVYVYLLSFDDAVLSKYPLLTPASFLYILHSIYMYRYINILNLILDINISTIHIIYIFMALTFSHKIQNIIFIKYTKS